MSEPKIRRLVNVYYGPDTMWRWSSKISEREELQYYDEKEKEWATIPRVVEYHYPYSKD